MTRGEKVAVLLDALDNGSILYNETKFKEKEYLFKTEKSYEAKGWGSALGTVEQRILDIVANPEEWFIFENFNMKVDEYPYPWSTKYQK
jgi:hypothetical protein